MKKLAVFATVFMLTLLMSQLAWAEDGQPSITISETYASKYITGSGGQIGEGPVSQTTFSVGMNGWYAYVWHNYDLELKETTEHDWGVGRFVQLGEGMGGKFGLDLSYNNWIFQGSDDHAIEASLSYSGPINTSFTATKVITTGLTSDQNRLKAKVEKSFQITENFTITPSISTAWHDNFFDSYGFAYVTGSLSAAYTWKQVVLSSSMSQQRGWNGKEDATYWNVNLKTSF